MSIAIQVDLSTVARLVERINKLSKVNTRQLMETIGAEVTSQTQRRIDSEKQGPDGTPWPVWSESYAQTRHGNQSLLVATGTLSETIRHEVGFGGESVEIGSNLVYAATHQFGLDMSIASSHRRVTIPARPYLGLSANNVADLESLLDDFADSQLEAL